MYESRCFCYVRTLTTFQTSSCIKELENEIPRLVPPTLGIVAPPLERKCRLINVDVLDAGTRVWVWWDALLAFAVNEAVVLTRDERLALSFYWCVSRAPGPRGSSCIPDFSLLGFNSFPVIWLHAKSIGLFQGGAGDLKPFQTVELEQMLMHTQVFYFQGRYWSTRCPGEPFTRMLAH